MASSSDMDSQVLVSYIPDSKEGMLAASCGDSFSVAHPMRQGCGGCVDNQSG